MEEGNVVRETKGERGMLQTKTPGKFGGLENNFLKAGMPCIGALIGRRTFPDLSKILSKFRGGRPNLSERSPS